MLFSANLHVVDRVARLVLAIGMFVTGWNTDDGTLAFVLRLFAFYPLATGLMGWSPVYEIFSFRTKR